MILCPNCDGAVEPLQVKPDDSKTITLEKEISSRSNIGRLCLSCQKSFESTIRIAA